MHVLLIIDTASEETFLEEINRTNELLADKNTKLKESISECEQKYINFLQEYYLQGKKLDKTRQIFLRLELELTEIKESAYCSDLINITNAHIGTNTNANSAKGFSEQQRIEKDMAHNDIVSGRIPYTANVIYAYICFFSCFNYLLHLAKRVLILDIDAHISPQSFHQIICY